MKPRHIRFVRKLALIVAAAPLFQAAACASGFNQVLGNVANSLPSTLFSIAQSAILSPIISFLQGGGGFTPRPF